jgi:Mg2+ and Co2+ transporter CorA
MKGITSISIILIIPALIASLYMMNFTNNLEAYPYALSIVVSVFAFVFVEKKKLLLIKPDFNFIFIISETLNIV